MFVALIDKDQLINDKVKSHGIYDLYLPKSTFFNR
ncbi:hypothetical protein SAMN05421542_1860 [Chryseobacterium jejuense]|uniref:Uncharacterized protein n=1 Tax=Chryseobacterium jejuense TaxID=445960 RepID=A0A2X2VDA1_CHRJE|nr:hypothetical protein SAMN05421542_1860 [Chryseobacterium jejuense]SQB26518.1 Uncharacterised protein [Chryseobacterium jejuense]